VKFEEGGSQNTKFSEITLLSGLYEAMTPELQVWANDWSRTLKKSGDPKAAAKTPKPSDESVEKHKKRRAAAMAGRNNDNSDNGGTRKKKSKDGKTQKSNASGPKSQRYPPSTSSPSDVIAPPTALGGPLSISKLGGGAASVPPNDKDFPVLCVILFKEPKGVTIPISSSSTVGQAIDQTQATKNGSDSGFLHGMTFEDRRSGSTGARIGSSFFVMEYQGGVCLSMCFEVSQLTAGR
jgi:hypothetical protein